MQEFFQIVFDDVFVIQMLIVSSSLIILFFDRKINVKTISFALAVTLVLSLLGTLLNAVTFKLFSYIRTFSSASYTTAYTLLFLGYYFVIKKNRRAKIIMLTSFLAIEVITTELASQIMRLFENNYGGKFNWISIVAFLLIISFAILMRGKNLFKFSDIPVSTVLLCVISNVIIILVTRAYTVYAAYNRIQFASIFTIIVFFSAYLITILTYLLSYGACMEKQTLIEFIAENDSMNSDQEMIRISQQTYNDIRAIKHDIKNQVSIMGLLIKEKKYDQLEQYFIDLGNSMSFSLDKIDCGNNKFNSVLNMEIAKARAYNILVSLNLIVPKDVPFHSHDICSILSNSIDNAIEYLHKKDIKDSPIGIDIYPKGEFLYIGVSNVVIDLPDSDNPVLKTNKADKVLHGIGHKIIAKAAKKYNGYVNYSISNHRFISEIMLDMKYVEVKK